MDLTDRINAVKKMQEFIITNINAKITMVFSNIDWKDRSLTSRPCYLSFINYKMFQPFQIRVSIWVKAFNEVQTSEQTRRRENYN